MQLADYTKQRGRQAALCRDIGAFASDVTNWVKGNRPVPEARCADIERVSGGQVTVEELRPDIAWVRIKDKTWPHPKGRPLVDVSRTEASEAA